MKKNHSSHLTISPKETARFIFGSHQALHARSHLAFLHLLSAIALAERAKIIEQEQKKELPQEPTLTEHRAQVTGAIILAVAFLEATVNELYRDATDGELPDNCSSRGVLKESSELSKKVATLEKYELALLLASKRTFKKDAEPYQSAYALIRLRNGLVHYEPNWIDLLAEKRPKIDSLLKNRFARAPWDDSHSSVFPHGCHSYDCARWAIRSSAQFVLAFLEKMGDDLNGWLALKSTEITAALKEL